MPGTGTTYCTTVIESEVTHPKTAAGQHAANTLGGATSVVFRGAGWGGGETASPKNYNFLEAPKAGGHRERHGAVAPIHLKLVFPSVYSVILISLFLCCCFPFFLYEVLLWLLFIYFFAYGNFFCVFFFCFGFSHGNVFPAFFLHTRRKKLQQYTIDSSIWPRKLCPSEIYSFIELLKKRGRVPRLLLRAISIFVSGCGLAFLFGDMILLLKDISLWIRRIRFNN